MVLAVITTIGIERFASSLRSTSRNSKPSISGMSRSSRIRSAFRNRCEGFAAVPGLGHFPALLLQRLAQCATGRLVVLGDQDRAALAAVTVLPEDRGEAATVEGLGQV